MVANPSAARQLPRGGRRLGVGARRGTAHLDPLWRASAPPARAPGGAQPARGGPARRLSPRPRLRAGCRQPGFAGQRFIPYALDKVRHSRHGAGGGVAGRDRVDGASPSTRRRAVAAGATSASPAPPCSPPRIPSRACASSSKWPQEPSHEKQPTDETPTPSHRPARLRADRRRRARRLQERAARGPAAAALRHRVAGRGSAADGDREVLAGAQVPHPRLRGGAQLRFRPRGAAAGRRRAVQAGRHAEPVQAEAKYRDFLNRFPTSERAAYVQLQIGNAWRRASSARPRPSVTPRRWPLSRTCFASTRPAIRRPRDGSGWRRPVSSASTSSRWRGSTTATASRSPPRSPQYLLATFPSTPPRTRSTTTWASP